jgi:ubiquinone/menaquinone biosynthesis C-methylase UbiE
VVGAAAAADETMSHGEPEVARRWAARVELWRQAFTNVVLAGKEVLDAGTGEGWFTRFLAEQHPARLVSVTCQREEIAPARRRLERFATNVEFLLADLTRLTAIADGRFDVVGADFLIAAVGAYRPFGEIDMLKELVRVLRPTGQMVLTGWEPAVAKPTPATAVFRQLLRLREAVHALSATPPFREHPSQWVAERLDDLGMFVERVCTVTDVHRDLSWLVGNIRDLLSEIHPRELAAVLGARLDLLDAELARSGALAHGLAFGQLYAVCARKGAVLVV